MFINKRRNGYGWYSKIVSKDQGGNTYTGYLNFVFKRGTEPQAESIQGEMYFIDDKGIQRKIFPVAKLINGVEQIDLILLEPDQKPTKSFGASVMINNEKIEEKELPFY